MGSRTGSVRPSVASIHLPPMRACDLNRAMSLRCAIIPICKRTQRIITKSLPILILHISLLCQTHTASAACTPIESSNLLREERGDCNPAQSIPIYHQVFNLCGFRWLKSRQGHGKKPQERWDRIWMWIWDLADGRQQPGGLRSCPEVGNHETLITT